MSYLILQCWGSVGILLWNLLWKFSKDPSTLAFLLFWTTNSEESIPVVQCYVVIIMIWSACLGNGKRFSSCSGKLCTYYSWWGKSQYNSWPHIWPKGDCLPQLYLQPQSTTEVQGSTSDLWQVTKRTLWHDPSCIAKTVLKFQSQNKYKLQHHKKQPLLFFCALSAGQNFSPQNSNSCLLNSFERRRTFEWYLTHMASKGRIN